MNVDRNLAHTPFKTLSLTELAELKFPPTRWVVDNLVPAGALTLLVGRPKAGKSLLTIDLAASVASGDHFLGRATEQGIAIYAPAEDSLPLVRERLNTRLGTEQAVPFFVLPVDGSLGQSLHLDKPESVLRLLATLKELRPRLLVLDPFRELHHRRENEADDMAVLLRPLRQIAHKLGISIVLVHHRNKSAPDAARAARGSSAITGGVDVIVTLDLSNESPDERLSSDQILSIEVEGRFGPRQRLAARLRPERLRWEAEEAAQLNDLTTSQLILGCLETSEAPLTADELQTRTGSSKSHIQNAVRALLGSRRLLRDGTGVKGSPFRYHLPADQGRLVALESGAYESSDEYFRATADKTVLSYASTIPSISGDPENPADSEVRQLCRACGGLLPTSAAQAGGYHDRTARVPRLTPPPSAPRSRAG